MGVQVIPIPTEVVSNFLSFPFPIPRFIPIPMGFQWDFQLQKQQLHSNVTKLRMEMNDISDRINAFRHEHHFGYNKPQVLSCIEACRENIM